MTDKDIEKATLKHAHILKNDMTMEKPKKYRAKNLNGEWVTGWYVELHRPTYNTQIPDRITGYDTVPHLFNDEQGERSKGSYWHSIDISTLTQIDEQLEIAWK